MGDARLVISEVGPCDFHCGETAGVGVVSRGVWPIKDSTRQRWSGVSVNCVKVWRVGQWVEGGRVGYS